jgi:hypothetical protein
MILVFFHHSAVDMKTIRVEASEFTRQEKVPFLAFAKKDPKALERHINALQNSLRSQNRR